jgi:hypothetical protein
MVLGGGAYIHLLGLSPSATILLYDKNMEFRRAGPLVNLVLCGSVCYRSC